MQGIPAFPPESNSTLPTVGKALMLLLSIHNHNVTLRLAAKNQGVELQTERKREGRTEKKERKKRTNKKRKKHTKQLLKGLRSGYAYMKFITNYFTYSNK